MKTFDEELNGRTLAVGLREGSPLGLSDDERVKTLEGRAVGRSVSLFEGCGLVDEEKYQICFSGKKSNFVYTPKLTLAALLGPREGDLVG